MSPWSLWGSGPSTESSSASKVSADIAPIRSASARFACRSAKGIPAAACIIAITCLLPQAAQAEVIRFGSFEGTGAAEHVLHADGGTAVLRYGTDGELIVPKGRIAQAVQDERARSISSVSASRAASLPIIRTIAARYQRHPTVQNLGLSERDWTAFFQAMIRIESGYRPEAVSSAGAIGLAQLMPATARTLRVNAHDPLENLDGGARYLIAQMGRFGSLELALAAYNAGPETVAKYGGIPPYGETRSHVRKVMAEYHRLLSNI